MTVNITVAAAQAEGAALATYIGANPTLEIRTGDKPATPETAATGTLLATVAISGSFTSSGGVLTSADPAAVAAVASGTAGYARIKQSDGTAVLDCDVTDSTGSGDVKLASTSVNSGVNIDLTAITITAPVS